MLRNGPIYSWGAVFILLQLALSVQLDDIRDSNPDRGKRLYLFQNHLALVPSQLHIQWVVGGSFPKVKRPELEVEHLHPSSGDVMNKQRYSTCLHVLLMAGEGKVYFTLLY